MTVEKPGLARAVARRLIAFDRAVMGGFERAFPMLLAHTRMIRELDRGIASVGRDCRGVLLDAGCGGRKFETCFPGIDRYIGMDLPDTRREMDYPAGGVDVYGDVYRIPVPDDRLDCVFSESVLEHLEDPHRCLREFYRVLKPGGRLIIAVPFLFQVHAPVHDFSRWTANGLKHLVIEAGFEMKRTVQVGGYATALWSLAEGYLLEYAWEADGRWLPVKFLLRPLQLAVCLLGNVLAAGLDLLWPSDRGCSVYVVSAVKPG